MLRFKPITRLTAYYDICTVNHEFDGHANHRLEIEGCVGEWGSYDDIVKIKWKDVTFCATTDYYFMVLPEVFVITPLREHDEEEKGATLERALTLAEKLAAKRAESKGS